MPHLIVFSHLRWDFVHQRPQHLLSRMAATHPVVYIEEPVRRIEPGTGSGGASAAHTCARGRPSP
jgi:UDP-galactopyranose mutase